MNETLEKRHMGLKASRTISNTIIYIILILMSVIWLIPFICIVLQSFRVESTWQVGYVIPKQWGWDNYIALWNSDFRKWYLNTFLIALIVAVLQTVIVLCMSYTLSRFRFKLRDGLMRFMLILGMFPGMLTMIILYRVLKDLGLKVERRPVPEEELPTFEEAGACGTAAVISPISELDDLATGKKYSFGDKPGPWSTKLYETLRGIQYGTVEDKHGWTTVVIE